MLSLSWKRYDDQYNLSELLTESARACVDAWASNPSAFFASYFTKVTTGDNVDKLQCEKIFTPQGMLGLSLTIRLFTNDTVTTTAFFSSESTGSASLFGDVDDEDGQAMGGLPLTGPVGAVSGSAGYPGSNSAPGVSRSSLSGPSGVNNSAGQGNHHSGVGGAGGGGGVYEPGSGAGGAGGVALYRACGPGWQTAVVKVLHRFLVDTLLPDLRQIPVTHQLEWDTVLESTKWDWDALQTVGRAGIHGRGNSIGEGVRAETSVSAVSSGMHGLSTANATGKNDPTGERLPSSVRFSFSLAASVVAAKSNKKNLYEYFRGLYDNVPRPPTTITGTPISLLVGGNTGQGRDMYTLPRLLLPFFGRSDTAAGNVSTTGGTAGVSGSNSSGPSSSSTTTGSGGGSNVGLAPPGSLCFHTLYLIPGTSVPSISSSAESGALNKTYGASGTLDLDDEDHHLQMSSLTNNPASRKQDGFSKAVGGGVGGGNPDYAPQFEDDDTSSRGTNVMDNPGQGTERGGRSSRGMLSSHHNMKGLVSEEVFERLLAAYRLFSDKMSGPAVREDGAFVHVHVENVVDAVQLASEVLQAVGLRPGVDVCFGMRIQCPVIRSNNNPGGKADGGSGSGTSHQPVSTSSSSTGKGSKRGAKNADQGKVEEIMYGLFAGDPEVTGAQVAEYLVEQVQACHGVLVFLEDTHDPQNVAGLYRLMSRLGNRVVISGQGMYGPGSLPQNTASSLPKLSHGPSLTSLTPQTVSPLPPPQLPQQHTRTEERRGRSWFHQIEAGITSMWSHNIAVPIRQVGSISRVMRVTMMLDAHSRSFTLSTRSDDRDLQHIVDLGISISASFISLGGLNLSTSCDAVSYFLGVQEQLARTRSLNDQPSIAHLTSGVTGLPPIPDEFVAEIKRKNDKKKKKTTKKP